MTEVYSSAVRLYIDTTEAECSPIALREPTEMDGYNVDEAVN